MNVPTPNLTTQLWLIFDYRKKEKAHLGTWLYSHIVLDLQDNSGWKGLRRLFSPASHSNNGNRDAEFYKWESHSSKVFSKQTKDMSINILQFKYHAFQRETKALTSLS